ncbi:MAG: aspartate kinase [Planctomycetota bacterium]
MQDFVGIEDRNPPTRAVNPTTKPVSAPSSDAPTTPAGVRPLVMKFGGTSVADADRLRLVAERVRAAIPAPCVVVLSATSGTTDRLLEIARAACAGDLARAREGLRAVIERHRGIGHALFGDSAPGMPVLEATFAELESAVAKALSNAQTSPSHVDAIAACGERLTTALLAAHLTDLGIAVERVDARRLLRTDDVFGTARPDKQATARLCAVELSGPLAAGRVVVTEGYIGSTEDGRTTTLGRGGSDYSASLLGAAIAAQEVQIWTDVEGVRTADPRVVADAQPVELLSFGEAAELAAFGAKVLHPATIQPAVEADVPVTVRHTLHPTGRYTTITGRIAEQRAVTAVASRAPITVLTITSSRMLAQPGFLARLFEVFARQRVSVDVVATAEVAVSLTVDGDAPIEALARELAAFAHVKVLRDRALVALIGERLRRTRSVAARVLEALSDVEIELMTFGANESNLSLIVPRENEREVIRRLHRSFFEGGRGR